MSQLPRGERGHGHDRTTDGGTARDGRGRTNRGTDFVRDATTAAVCWVKVDGDARGATKKGRLLRETRKN